MWLKYSSTSLYESHESHTLYLSTNAIDSHIRRRSRYLYHLPSVSSYHPGHTEPPQCPPPQLLRWGQSTPHQADKSSSTQHRVHSNNELVTTERSDTDRTSSCRARQRLIRSPHRRHRRFSIPETHGNRLGLRWRSVSRPCAP